MKFAINKHFFESKVLGISDKIQAVNQEIERAKKEAKQELLDELLKVLTELPLNDSDMHYVVISDWRFQKEQELEDYEECQ